MGSLTCLGSACIRHKVELSTGMAIIQLGWRDARRSASVLHCRAMRCVGVLQHPARLWTPCVPAGRATTGYGSAQAQHHCWAVLGGIVLKEAMRWGRHCETCGMTAAQPFPGISPWSAMRLMVAFRQMTCQCIPLLCGRPPPVHTKAGLCCQSACMRGMLLPRAIVSCVWRCRRHKRGSGESSSGLYRKGRLLAGWPPRPLLGRSAQTSCSDCDPPPLHVRA